MECQHFAEYFRIQRLPGGVHDLMRILREGKFRAQHDDSLFRFFGDGRCFLLLCGNSGEHKQPGKRLFQYRQQSSDSAELIHKEPFLVFHLELNLFAFRFDHRWGVGVTRSPRDGA